MLKELRTQHRNIIQMSFNGYKNNEIAERLGMAQSSVSIILRSPLGQAYLKGLEDRAHETTLDVRKKLVSLNKFALDTFERLLNPKEKAPHAVQYNTAKDVLDRNGYKAPDRIFVDMTMQTKTDQEIDAEISAMQQSLAKVQVKDIPKIATNPLDAVEPELDEASLLELISDDNDMDSSDQLVNSAETTYQDESIESLNDASLNSNAELSEESISLLSGLPANIFQVRS
jgi:predicted transcriptional regulator